MAGDPRRWSSLRDRPTRTHSNPPIRLTSWASRRAGHREIALLLPVAMVLLALLALFTVGSYRSGILALREERHGEAERLARTLASQYADGPPPPPAALRLRAPGARGIALLSPAGAPLSTVGNFPPTTPLAPPATWSSPDPAPTGHGDALVIGPAAEDGLVDVVAAFVRAPSGRLARVDLPAARLAEQLASVRLLTVVVLAVAGATLLLAILLLRQLVAPIEALLGRARRAGALDDGEDPEALVAVFDRALSALAAVPRPGHELATLASSLAPRLASGLVLLDREQRVLAVNPAALELLGLPSIAADASLADALAPLPGLASRLAAALAPGALERSFDYAHAGAAGGRTLGLAVHPLLEDGEARGALVLVADLTHQREAAAEERLAATLAELAALGAGVAHELRNGLATVRGYVAMLASATATAPEREWLQALDAETRHLTRVVADFLAFSTPARARFEPVDLEALVATILADPGLAAPAPQRRGAPHPDAIVRGDGHLLGQALRNLLHNARQADPAGAIEVELAPGAEGGWEILIDDRGPGVPDALRDRLFRPFVSGRPGGVGLGLAVSHRILAAHGGRLELLARGEGGTRARLWLPGTNVP